MACISIQERVIGEVRVRWLGAMLEGLPARCASQAEPAGPASAAALGSLNRRSSRALSFARALAVQYAVDSRNWFDSNCSFIGKSRPPQMGFVPGGAQPVGR